MPDRVYSGRVGLQQRVLPAYRIPFLDDLAQYCKGGMSVFAGKPGADEAISTADHFERAAYFRAQNKHFNSINHPLYICWQTNILAWLDDWNPDLLVAEANPRYPGTSLAVRWMHGRKRPVIGWGLGSPPARGLLSSLQMMLRRAFLRQFDALIAYSQRGGSEYRALGISDIQIFIATNAVAPIPTIPPVARSESFGPKPTVLFIGRLQVRKRIDNLLRACASLPVKYQPNLWIIGDGPARQALEALAGSVYPQASFLGALFGSKLAPYFNQADVFVLPGTGGLAVQQAMAYGLPVIVARGDGTQEDLVRPANGWLIPPDDQDALTATLKDALTDPSRLRAMGAESYRIVSEEINTDQMVKVFLHAFQHVSQ